MANYVQERLFKDERAVTDLVKSSRSTAQRIYQYLRDMVQAFTGRLTPEQQQIRKAERMFAKALGETEAGAEGGEARYLIGYDVNKKPYVIVQNDILSGAPQDRWIKTVKAEMRRLFPDGIDMGYFRVDINSVSKNELTRSKETLDLKNNRPNIYTDKMRMLANLDEIIQNAYDVKNEDPKHARKDRIRSFNRGHIDIRVGNNDYSVEVVTGIYPSTNEIVYDIVNIRPTQIKTPPNGQMRNSQIPKNGSASVKYYAQPAQNVNNHDENTKNSFADTSISDFKALDTDYMQAVESGDTETQQRLVDEAQRSEFKDTAIFSGVFELSAFCADVVGADGFAFLRKRCRGGKNHRTVAQYRSIKFTRMNAHAKKQKTSSRMPLAFGTTLVNRWQTQDTAARGMCERGIIKILLRMDLLFCGKAVAVATVHRTVAKCRSIKSIRTNAHTKSKRHPNGCLLLLVGADGFEPSKSLTTDLQSAPFGHLGTLPY